LATELGVAEHKAGTPTYLAPPTEEDFIWQVRLSMWKALQRVPKEKKQEYLKLALEEITALLGDQAS
jgi:hypothetical protein